MRNRRGLATLAIVALAAATVAVAASGTAAKPAFAPKDCSKPRIEPKTITITCADANFFVKIRHWAVFNKVEARGKGKAMINTCMPDCASGEFKAYKVKVHLKKPKKTKCNGRKVPVFSKIQIRFKDDPPAGVKRKDNYPLFCA
jgi:hypothetical protein